jgi:hypothetical protein
VCDCLFSSHLSQGYLDLRISVDRKFKISKGVEASCLWNLIFRKLRENLWRLRASEVLRKSSEAPIFTDLALSLNRRGVKGNKESSKDIPLPRVNQSSLSPRSNTQIYFHRFSFSLSRRETATPIHLHRLTAVASPPSPPVTAPLAGYPREAVPPFTFVGRRWGVSRKRSPWIPYGEQEEGSNPHPFLLILWCVQALKIFIVLLLDPNQGNQRPYPNPNPKFLDLHAD